MDRDLQARIDRIKWYHEFDFPDGLRARSQAADVALHRRIWRFIEEHLEPIDFRGKTVLDIGAWDGFWSFYAERRGAAQVLATDDLTQNWSDGQGIHLAKEILRSKVEVEQGVSVYALDKLDRKFDVILCLGVYYHLLDPLCAFAQIRHRCHPDSLVLLDGDIAVAGVEPRGAAFPFAGPERQAFVPSQATLTNLLRAAYLDVRSQTFLHRPVAHSLWRGWRLLSGGMDPHPRVDRAFTVCAPFAGVNDLHRYAPPFGLALYDDRFRHASHV